MPDLGLLGCPANCDGLVIDPHQHFVVALGRILSFVLHPGFSTHLLQAMGMCPGPVHLFSQVVSIGGCKVQTGAAILDNLLPNPVPPARTGPPPATRRAPARGTV